MHVLSPEFGAGRPIWEDTINNDDRHAHANWIRRASGLQTAPQLELNVAYRVLGLKALIAIVLTRHP